MKLPLTIESRTSNLQSGGQVFEAELMDDDLRIMARVYGYEAEAAITHLPIGKDEVDTTARQIQRAVNSYESLVSVPRVILDACRDVASLKCRSAEDLYDGILSRLLEIEMEGLLDIVLDALGVPADNTVETNACDIANTTGEWPEGAYCRDFWYDAWSDIQRGKSVTTIANFPAWVREQLVEQSSTPQD